VTLYRPVGSIPTGPKSMIVGFSRGGAFAAAGVLAAINAQASHIIGGLTQKTLLDALLGLGGVSAVIWAAMFAAWQIGSEDDTPLVGAVDYGALGVLMLFSFIPLSYAAQAGVLLCGSYLLVTAGTDAQRRSAFVLLALTGPLIWGRLILRLFAAPILSLDAHVVGAAIGSRVSGNAVHFAGSSEEFLIGGGCSSVHNMSLAILLWTTVAMLFKIRIDRGYLLIGLAMVTFMFLLNVVRLSTIGLFPDHFYFLHFGAGADMFGWAGLIGAALLAGAGVTYAAARQR
jgi:hypothetical protein